MAYTLFMYGGQQAGHVLGLVTTTDNAATVEAANYFNDNWNELGNNGVLFANMGDASKTYKYVVDRDNHIVTITAFA